MWRHITRVVRPPGLRKDPHNDRALPLNDWHSKQITVGAEGQLFLQDTVLCSWITPVTLLAVMAETNRGFVLVFVSSHGGHTDMRAHTAWGASPEQNSKFSLSSPALLFDFVGERLATNVLTTGWKTKDEAMCSSYSGPLFTRGQYARTNVSSDYCLRLLRINRRFCAFPLNRKCRIHFISVRRFTSVRIKMLFKLLITGWVLS